MTSAQLGVYRRYRSDGMTARLAHQLATDAARPAYPFLADPDARVGDDNVTGWFTDRWEPGCVSNRASGINADPTRWYRPSNYELDHEADDLRPEGVSRGTLLERLAERIERAMTDDAERTYDGIVATVSFGGHTLGPASVWAIHIHCRHDPASYLIATAARLVVNLGAAADETRNRDAVRLRQTGRAGR